MEGLHLVSLILYLATGVFGTIDHLELIMPRYAIKGGNVILKCEHSVPPEQLHKVEWQKGGNKIFQYIKGRKPPFRVFPILDAELNKANSNEKQIQLTNLNFEASGSYSCAVSMETPIFTKDSESKDLTIIEPQKSNPVMIFNKDAYEIGEVLEANCTSAPARPPPHITWLINGEKVMDSLTKSFTNGLIHGHDYFNQRGTSVKQLSIEVSELHVGDDGELQLTCMSTIPGYVNHNENYADKRVRTVTIDIQMTDRSLHGDISNNTPLSSGANIYFSLYFLVFIFVQQIILKFY